MTFLNVEVLDMLMIMNECHKNMTMVVHNAERYPE